MNAWPDSMKTGSIREWPGQLNADRRRAQFSATLTSTLRILDREVWNLVDTRAQQDSAELLIAIPAGVFRRDGRPYANARPEHPGMIFSLDSRHGHLSYPCDASTTWQDNLRAIALALEALRKVDRYGVTRHGEQYRGFLELEATAAPAGFATAEAAHEWLLELIDAKSATRSLWPSARLALRRAQQVTHPKRGGDAATFQRVSLAEAKLREVGLL